MKLNFRWVEKKFQYASGENLFLNRIHVASYSWNSSGSSGDGDDRRYVGDINLPSRKDKQTIVYGATPAVLKGELEKIVTAWFAEALRE